MGLVISYRLSLISPTIDTIHQKVVELRNIATNLGFIQVGEITTLEGDKCTIDMEDDGNDPNIELKIHASEMIGYEDRKFLFRHPSVIIGFRCQPGEGCTMADFGFRIFADQENSQEWTWFNYCKTQYASNSEYGGLENFINCHLKVVHLLDAAQEMGIVCDVSDCGEYWESRDLSRLAKVVSDGNLLTAVVMGAFKDVASEQNAKFTAPILDYPNFEYLEGEGQTKLSTRK